MISARALRRRCALILLAVAAAVPLPSMAKCSLAKIATFPLIREADQVLIPGKLNGHDIVILVDTGAAESLIWEEAATRAGLKLVRDHRMTMVGFSGEAKVYKTTVDELQIGDYTLRDRKWPVVEGGDMGDLGMILGIDFWSKVDFEINMAGGEIILWQAVDCKDEPLVYWSQSYMMAKLDVSRRRIEADVLVNGQEVRAMIDTGATITAIDSKHARRVGFRPLPGMEGAIQGVGNRGAVDSFVAVFDKFQFGDLEVKNAHIQAFDMDHHTRETVSTGTRLTRHKVDFEDMFIGADFLRANRVLIANSQGRLYMTYQGGRIFQTEEPQAATVEETSAGE